MLDINGRSFTQPLTGVQRYAYEVTSRLKLPHRVLSPTAPLPYYSGIDSEVFPKNVSINGHFWEQFALPLATKGNSLWSPGGIGPVKKTRHILTIHDLAHIEYPEWYSRSYSRLYSTLYPISAKNASAILTVSEFTADKLMSVFDIKSSKIHVTPLGVQSIFTRSCSESVAATKSRYSIKKRYVLFVGASSKRKNLRALFDAWMIIRDQHKDVELIIAGPSGLAFSGKSNGGNPDDNVRSIGPIPDSDLVNLYSGAECFVYPSLYEGFGIPPLEAMACGTPVIASNTTAMPLVLKDAAILVNPHSIDEIASSIHLILSDENLRQEMVSRGIRLASQYTWEKTASLTQHVLDQSI